MFLVAPYVGKRRWDIRFRNHDGRIVKISGDRNRATALRLAERIDMLVKARQNGDPPPSQLADWISNMPPQVSDRLIELGLLTRRRLDRGKTLPECIDEWEKVVAARNPESDRHAPQQGAKVRRIVGTLKIGMFEELDEGNVLKAIASFDLATSTRRSYGIAIKDFAAWYAAARSGWYGYQMEVRNR